MDDLTILHLSDLHFDYSGAQPMKLYNSLLADIKEEFVCYDNIVICVTGDIINQNKYEGRELAIYFFKELKKIFQELNKKIQAIYFVPGNHDKTRSYSTDLLLNCINTYDEKFYTEFNNFFCESFEKYKKLIKEIIDIFELGDQFDNSTFGCNELILNNKQFVFVRFNTAWCAKGNLDRRNLKIGQFQISKIEKEYRELVDKNISGQGKFEEQVVICLAHHPLNWLIGSEEDYIQNFLIGQRGIDAQIFLCGHTHTRDIINWSNNRQSLTTLSTGIGRPDSFESSHSDLHAYSIYVLHTDLNAIDIYVRSTNDGGKFVPDHRIYTSEENRKHNKIILPLNSTKIHSYFELGSAVGSAPKVNFLTNQFIQRTEQFVEALGWLRQRAIQEAHFRYETYKEMSEKGENQENINKQLFMDFTGYLQTLCDYFNVELLRGYTKPEDNDGIRFHFRCICLNEDIENINYPHLCSSYWPDKSAISNEVMKTLKFGELIKAAFEKHRPLIYSANKDLCFSETKWHDFITVVPDCEENIYRVSGNHHCIKEYPIITFGASVSAKMYKPFLFCLDYYRFDRILNSFLQLYVNMMNIKLLDFAKYCKNIYWKE